MAPPSPNPDLRPDPSTDEPDGVDLITGLREVLVGFVGRELVDARSAACASAVQRLADDLADADALAAAAAGITAGDLARRLGQFAAAAAAHRRLQAEDELVLAAAVQAIDADLAIWMASEGRVPVPGAAARFAEIAAQVPLRQLEARLDDEICTLVEARFDEVRVRAAERVEGAWEAAAAEFSGRAQARADAIRSIAQDTFGARLSPAAPLRLTEEPDRFWYQFHRPELPDAPLWRELRLLLPHPWVRRRLVNAARKRLTGELDKHAGRARSALSDRLAATHRRFASDLGGYIDAVIADIGRATQTTRHHADAADDRVARDLPRRQRLAAAVAEARAALADQPRTRDQ